MSKKIPEIIRNTCYFCTSTYQLFSILSLALSKNEKADLFIDPQFKNANEFAQKIEAEHIFEHVYIIDSDRIYREHISHDSGILNKLQIALTYFHVDEIAKIITEGDVMYQNIYVSSRAFIPRLYILSCIHRKLDTKVFYFDDGVGSYYGNSAIKPSRFDGWIRRILFGKEALNFNQDRYLMSPNMYLKINGDVPYQVLNIDRFWNHDEYRGILDRVFSLSDDIKLNEAAIILEELSDEYFDEKNLDYLNSVYNYSLERFGEHDLLLKSHPRSQKAKRTGFRYFEKFELPFEILCMKNAMNKKVLISVGSTGVATPKLITDQEPYVILLYRFINHEGMTQEPLEHFFVALKNAYDDPSRVMIPSSLEEFKSCFDKVMLELRK